MGIDLSAAALAFSKVLSARQRGTAAGAQRAREDAAAAEQDAIEQKRSMLDIFLREQTADKNRREAELAPKSWGEELTRLSQTEAARANAQAAARLSTQQPTTPRIDPLSPDGISAAAKRAAEVEKAKAPFARAGADQSGRAMRQATQLTGMYNQDPTFKEAGIMASALGGLKAASTGNTPAADISLIYSYMKLMDPGSVVREGEFATAQNAGSIPDSIRNAYNKALSGTRLSPEQRQMFVTQAEAKARAHRAQLRATMQRYASMAQRYGVDPADVVFDPYEAVLDATPTAPGAPRAGKPGVPPVAPNPWRP